MSLIFFSRLPTIPSSSAAEVLRVVRLVCASGLRVPDSAWERAARVDSMLLCAEVKRCSSSVEYS